MNLNLPFDFINNFSFSAESVVDLIFFLVTTFVGVVSLILFFHWRKYAIGGIAFAFTEIIYLVVCVGLLIVAFFGIN